MIRPADYKQTDVRWGKVRYATKGETSTVKSAGCGPAAMADVLAAVVSPYIDVLTCASWAKMHGYKVYKSGTAYSYPVAQGRAYGVEIRRLNAGNVYGKSKDAVHGKAEAELKRGNWLIACMGKGIWTSTGHYLSVYGLEGGKVYINDPASYAENRSCNLWEIFLSQVKYYWVVEVPEVIKKNGCVSEGDYSREEFIREVQLCILAETDGIAGKETLFKTITVSAKKNRRHPVVLPLQKYLRKEGYYAGALDSIAGERFTQAVNAFQCEKLGFSYGDGEITAGAGMWRFLLGI